MRERPRASWKINRDCFSGHPIAAQRPWALIVALLSVLLLLGCVSLAHKGKLHRSLFERSARKKPEWIVRLPPSDRFFYATGFATSATSLAEGKKAAAMAAVEEIVAYFGLQTSTRFQEKRTNLVTEVLNLIDSSAAARVTSGRMAELYFEHYRDISPDKIQDLYDVYVLFRVPMEEIEAERAWIIEERSKAVEQAEAALENVSEASLGEDFIGGIARLSGTYRHLARVVPSSGMLNRLETRLGEIAARTSLTLEVLDPAPEGGSNVPRLRARAALLGTSGAIPIKNLPLAFEVTQGAGVVEATRVTNEEGEAEVVLTRPVGIFPGTVVQVRLHPSILPALPSLPETEKLLAPLVASLSALRGVSAHLPVAVARKSGAPDALTGIGQGSPPDSSRREDAVSMSGPGIQSVASVRSGQPVLVMTGSRRVSLGSQNVLFPVLTRLTSPPAGVARRPQLNIALVLDTSGSMVTHEKLDYLKKGAAMAVRYLGEGDTLCIVTYSTEPSVLFPAGPFPGRRTLLHVLGMLKAEGRTNLSGGIQTAIREIRPYIRADNVSRIILLTDGLANEGITSTGGLSQLAAQIRGAGVSLTTIGLGRDFNSRLLRRMANEGEGRYYYASSADKLPGILSREVEGLLAQTMGDITIDLTLASGVVLERSFGYPVHTSGRQLQIPAGSLSEGGSRTLLLELGLSCQEEGVKPIGTLRVQYRNWLEEGRWVKVKEDLAAHCSSDFLASDPMDGSVMSVYLKLMRALDRLEVALNSGDQNLKAELESFLQREEPSIRAQATALGDRELLDLLALFHHAMEEVWEWGEISHPHEAGDEPDLRRDVEYRIYMLRHHGSEHKLLRPDWEEEESASHAADRNHQYN